MSCCGPGRSLVLCVIVQSTTSRGLLRRQILQTDAGTSSEWNRTGVFVRRAALPWSSVTKGEPIARGYEAIVYGDHGPYIEFREEQIYWPTFCRHKLKGPSRTHFEHYNRDISIKLYGQFKTVADQPNPPADSNPFACSNNRPEGYADYRPGRFYTSADALFESGGCAR